MAHLNVIGREEFSYITDTTFVRMYPSLFLNIQGEGLFLDILLKNTSIKLTKDYRMTDERLFALRDLKNILEIWV